MIVTDIVAIATNASTIISMLTAVFLQTPPFRNFISISPGNMTSNVMEQSAPIKLNTNNTFGVTIANASVASRINIVTPRNCQRGGSGLPIPLNKLILHGCRFSGIAHTSVIKIKIRPNTIAPSLLMESGDDLLVKTLGVSPNVDIYPNIPRTIYINS